MNIAIQCCGLLLTLIVLYFYISSKKVHLDSEKVFFWLIMAVLLCVLTDILSVVCIYFFKDRIVSFIMCRIYLTTVILTSYYSLAYIFSDIYGINKRFKRIMIMFGLIAACMAVAVFCIPISIIVDGRDIYITGAGCHAAYTFSVIFIACIIIIFFRFRNIINKKKREAVGTFAGFWLLAMIIRFFFPNLLFVSFAIATGILIIYIVLENPESAIDRETGLFNQNTFRLYVTQRYIKEMPFSLIMITFHNFNKTNSRESMFRKKEIMSLFSGIESSFAFRTNDDDLFIIFENKMSAEDMYGLICRRYINDESSDARPCVIYMPYSGIVDNVEDMLYMLRYANRDAEASDCNTMMIDEKFKEMMMADRNMEIIVNDAIENGRIEVFYQPIYSTQKKCFSSAEALVRIRDENGEIIPPVAFIEIAERNGMILKLGRNVFENVCRLISESSLKEYGLEYIEVNLSVVQCEYENLAKEFIGIMKEYGVQGKYINLEITETATMASKKKLLNNMNTLRDYGVSFSLDDFGTGQSNLNYIVDMPVDIVKFDRGMTTAYFESGKAKYVMDAAMHMI